VYLCFACSCDPCRDGGPGTDAVLPFILLNKITHTNLLDYSAGSWTDTVRVREIKTRSVVGGKPGTDGSMSITFFDENNDADAITTLKNKKYVINLQHSRDTFDIFFKMKEGKCKSIQIETMRIKYLDSTYYWSTEKPTFIFVKP
jgi:hypothetical protein